MNLFTFFLMSPPPSGAGAPAPWMQLLPWAAIFVVFYFFMIRPQSVKAKEERKFRDNLQKGDRVVTIGGMHGKIAETSPEWIILESESQAKFKVERSAISKETTLNAYPPASK
ncbi:MAG: preprotein translocase subunit YajC [Sphingomonadales bacterium]|nr:preprotein translocase subunit YajC [Sphingomonadales bacterium]MBM3923585.1 preprotein translocase subunit YajC [Sphingomonadales bacterium]MBM3931579.1 preprotein translocase subunit YajC [Sphingomonadales bacterium]